LSTAKHDSRADQRLRRLCRPARVARCPCAASAGRRRKNRPERDAQQKIRPYLRIASAVASARRACRFVFERQRDIRKHGQFRSTLSNAADAPVGLRIAATTTLVSSHRQHGIDEDAGLVEIEPGGQPVPCRF
jgi:hypothetical protein